jgi:hypothetical protein
VLAGVGALTANAHVIQADNTLQATGIVETPDQPSWDVLDETRRILRPVLSQEIREWFVDPILNQVIPWLKLHAIAIAGWIATEWHQFHDWSFCVLQAAKKMMDIILSWSSD